MDHPLPQNIVAELFSLLNRTITVIEKQSDLIIRQSSRLDENAIRGETAELNKSSDALKNAVAHQQPK